MSGIAVRVETRPQHRKAPRHVATAWSFLLLSVLAGGLCLLFPSPSMTAAAFTVVSGGAVVAITVGVRRHQPSAPLAWRCLLAASLMFFAGSTLRTLVQADVAPPSYLPFTLSALGYLIAAVGLAVWVHARNKHANTDTILDTALFGLGAALAAWVLLIAPLTTTTEALDTTIVTSALYPILDAVLLTLLVHVVLTTARGDRSFWLLGLSLLATFLGDLGYASDAAGLVTAPNNLLDLPFFLGYGALGAAALHPSMLRISTPQPRLRYRGWQRTIGITVVLAMATLTQSTVPSGHTTDRVLRAALFGALLVGVLLRSERALRRFAAGESAARHESFHDELTGLPNRAQLFARNEEKDQQAEGSAPIALLFMDLDGFKFVNDTYGHSVGDELLVATAVRLRDVARADDLVARYGGDEFVIRAYMEHMAAEWLASRIITALSEPFMLSVGRVFVSASIGIALTGCFEDDSDIESLIRKADAAMYHAKSRGRGGYAFYDVSLRSEARIQIETSTALRDALENDEFEMHYQPIVDLNTLRTVGYEALLRWTHDGKEHRPDEFIPIAEASDIIMPIGVWVLRTACTQLAAWRAAGHESLHMAVNVSARQLRDETLVQTVRAILAETGLPGHALWLELTETALVDDTEVAHRVLQALTELEVSICLDDFGTGYSALSYLQNFPISVVKIDGTFVRALGGIRPEATIVGAIEKMSTALGMRTVAEGVETEEQEAHLRELGCILVQGFRFGRPQPARLIEEPESNRALEALPDRPFALSAVNDDDRDVVAASSV